MSSEEEGFRQSHRITMLGTGLIGDFYTKNRTAALPEPVTKSHNSLAARISAGPTARPRSAASPPRICWHPRRGFLGQLHNAGRLIRGRAWLVEAEVHRSVSAGSGEAVPEFPG
jgi:hypothetical protein